MCKNLLLVLTLEQAAHTKTHFMPITWSRTSIQSISSVVSPPQQVQEGKPRLAAQTTGKSCISFCHPPINVVSPAHKKNKGTGRALPPLNVREVVSNKCTSWLVVNGMQWSDWWRELEVRRSASSSYKAADCYSSTDYSNLDLQQAQRVCVWQDGCCFDFFLVEMSEWV